MEIPLLHLINNDPVMTNQHSSYSSLLEVPKYVFDQNEVWGATAMILSEFKMLMLAELSK